MKILLSILIAFYSINLKAQNITKEYLEKKAFLDIQKDTSLQIIDNQLITAKLRFILKGFTDQEKKNDWLYSILKEQIENYGIKNIDYIRQSFNENCTNPKYLNEINELYEKEVTGLNNHIIKEYKTFPHYSLDLHIFYPDKIQSGLRYPAIVLFHGGGWTIGKPAWVFSNCKHLASKSIISISAQYRISNRHGTTPVECIIDAKSAIRWIRAHADELQIDPDRIIAGGVSAGGHIAACAAMIKGFEESSEDLRISSVPQALILYCPSVNTITTSWFKKLCRTPADFAKYSPYNHISPNLPPTFIFHGRKDGVVPFWTIEQFTKEMKKAGNRCDLYVLKDGGHVYEWTREEQLELTKSTDEFLTSLGYIQ